MSSRQAIRNTIRTNRQQLEPALQSLYSESICTHLARDYRYIRAQHIAFYLPHKGEASLLPLLYHSWDMGKQVYLPVLGLRYTGRLWFVPYTPATTLYINRFGIPEPCHHQGARRTKLRNLDMILMPLVAYDDHGHRMGMGGGFYDKTLASLHTQQRYWQRPRRIGIAYSLQHVEQIKSEKWDVPLDAIATENGLKWLRR